MSATLPPSAAPAPAEAQPGAAPAAGAAPGRPARRAAARPQGQWALGDRAPLNANEAFKQADDGLNVRRRIEEVYSREGFASIPADDLSGRMRWWGLYTQRREGVPGGRTAALDAAELSAPYFMLRVRSDGGALDAAQLRAVADVSTAYARGTADITDRQNVQLHWVRIEDVPAIWERLEAVGLTTAEACGDTPRVVLGSPVAGVAAHEVLDGTPAVEEIVRRYVGDPQFSNLPRKFKSAVSGSADVAHEVNDLSFVGAVHPERGPGFDVWVGGGLSTAPHLAVRLGAWVPRDDVPRVWAAVVSLFRDHGYRRSRHRARLKFLVADWGAQRFRQVLEEEYLGGPLADGPPPPPQSATDHVGVHPQADGRVYVGAAPTVGRVSGTVLAAVADLAEAHGDGRVRLTPQQKVVLLGVEPAAAPAVVAGLAALGLRVEASAFRRGTMACTGIEYCKLALVETKATAARLVDELERRLPGFDAPLALHVNGCPNSCARFQVADLGFKGVLGTAGDGTPVDAFQVHVGGSLGQEAGFGATVRGLRVNAPDLPDYVERVLRRYEAGRLDGEPFARWATRVDEGELL